MFKYYESVLGFIEKIGLKISSICLLLIMFVISFDVVTRKYFDFSIPSLYELNAEYGMNIIFWLALSVVFVAGGHVRVTLFWKMLPETIRPIIDKLMGFGGLVFFVLVAYCSWDRAMRAFQFGETSNNLLAYPLGPALLLVPFGSTLISLRILQSIISPQSIEKHQSSSEEIIID